MVGIYGVVVAVTVILWHRSRDLKVSPKRPAHVKVTEVNTESWT